MRDARSRTPRAVPVPRTSRQRADVPRAGVTRARNTPRTLDARLSPRGLVSDPSVPIERWPAQAGDPRTACGADRRYDWPARTTHVVKDEHPDSRAATGSLKACRWDLLLHDRGPASALLTTACPNAVHIRDLPDQPTSDARVANRRTRFDAGPTSQPMPICPPPRESRRTVLAPDAFHQPAALLEPLGLPGCRHPDWLFDVVSPLAPGLGLGPRGARQPQPANLVWA